MGKIITCTSDTHMNAKKLKVPDSDIFIYSGDLSFDGSLNQISREIKALDKVNKHLKNRILIAGNHDFLAEKDPAMMRNLCEEKGFIYLDESSVEGEGFKVYGSPISPFFCDWAFNRERGSDIKKHWDNIPDDTDILVTHGPPFQILDKCDDGNMGCKDLMDAIF